MRPIFITENASGLATATFKRWWKHWISSSSAPSLFPRSIGTSAAPYFGISHMAFSFAFSSGRFGFWRWSICGVTHGHGDGVDDGEARNSAGWAVRILDQFAGQNGHQICPLVSLPMVRAKGVGGAQENGSSKRFRHVGQFRCQLLPNVMDSSVVSDHAERDQHCWFVAWMNHFNTTSSVDGFILCTKRLCFLSSVFDEV